MNHSLFALSAVLKISALILFSQELKAQAESVVDFLPKVKLEVAVSVDSGGKFQIIVLTKTKSDFEDLVVPADCEDLPVALVLAELTEDSEEAANAATVSETGWIVGDPVIDKILTEKVIAHVSLKPGDVLRQSITNGANAGMTLRLDLEFPAGRAHCFGDASAQVFNAAGNTVSLVGFGTFSTKERAAP
ncbi:MAG: hypothetical protein ACU841_17905 [Gammaproteobacteria bacterium]